jgi:hypothetical protein
MPVVEGPDETSLYALSTNRDAINLEVKTGPAQFDRALVARFAANRRLAVPDFAAILPEDLSVELVPDHRMLNRVPRVAFRIAKVPEKLPGLG